MTTLVTGAAGFIGFHVSRALLERGETVIGVDNMSPYYDVTLKERRLDLLSPFEQCTIIRGDIANQTFVEELFATYNPQRVCHLAAQPGVRYSLQNPQAYVQSNVVGFVNVIEAARRRAVQQFVYASSSSVYGANKKTPGAISDRVDQPISLYAATKRADELIAHVYSHLYRLPTTGLRFFTVYGPYGRPDMAPFLFTRAIIAGEPITLFNNGQLERDFTYIDDIVAGVIASLETVRPYALFNLGNNHPVPLLSFVECLERAIGKPALKTFAPLQPGDVVRTAADITESSAELDFQPRTSIEEGTVKFVQWYREFYSI